MADYLLGKKLKYIEGKWGVSNSSLTYYLRKVGCFKLRSQHGKIFS